MTTKSKSPYHRRRDSQRRRELIMRIRERKRAERRARWLAKQEQVEGPNG